ncbi:hypothetical protein C121_72 [Stenotrophomonas phage C121]|uniref:hypothetical protein n=1 Tax=Stenotrophomonas phage C121 TaxID=2914029 RepID=UPI00232997D0|nr:hypothetical protein PP752_gp72 [Stenotrophomonas phage C121]UKL14805.1 hypothetical protein C121_72 [Stenotrophomonas phage C121]
MSIEFKIGEDAIFAALHAHVATLANTVGKHVSIKLKAGRGKNGYSATVLVSDEAETLPQAASFLPSEPKKTSTTTTTRGYEEETMQRMAAPVEMSEPDVAPVEADTGAEEGDQSAEAERPSLFQRK